MKRFPFFLTLLLGVAVGCGDLQRGPAGDSGGTCVTASITAPQPDSRADFDPATYCQHWRSGDRISVFDLSGNTAFDLVTGAGTTEGSFHSDINLEEGDTYYALYPYNPVSSLENGAIRTHYPDTLRYDPASGCALGANLMAAVSQGMAFTFYNAATFIQLTMAGAEIIETISISAKDGRAVAGAASLTFADNRVAAVSIDPDGAKSILVDFGEGLALSGEPVTVILAVPPVFENGFTLDFSTRSGRIGSKGSSNPTVLNTLLQMPEFHYTGISYATLATGSTFNAAIKNLANATTNATSSTNNTSIRQVSFVTGADLSQIAGGVDVSAAGDGSVLATFAAGTLTVSTSCDRIKTAANASYLFSRLQALTTLTGTDQVLTDEATNLRNMFHYCLALQHLDVSWINVDNVTNLTSFINHCEGLLSIDLSSWNPAKVTDISYLFNACTKLQSITLGAHFRNLPAKNLYSLFQNCKALTQLDAENLNLSGVTSLSRLFTGCSSLTQLDLSETTTSFTKADSAFFGCTQLSEVDLSGFNTRGATHIRQFFGGCSVLKDVSLGQNFVLSAANRAGFFPALSESLPAGAAQWEMPLATAQALISEYDDAAKALRSGILILMTPSGDTYRYKDAQQTVVDPTTLASLEEVKALTVCEP